MKLALLAVLACTTVSLRAADWKPIPPEDLALKQPRVDPKADAEVLLWDITVFDQAANNQYPFTVRSFYVRLKIFTDRGAKNFESPEIPYRRKWHVSEVAGRTIQPDGSEQELAKNAIIDHLLEKRKGVNDRAVSLPMPNVKPGTIIEYRWRETHDDELADNVALPGGREIPVERVVYHVKPLVHPAFPYSMRYQPLNANIPQFKAEPNGFFMTSIENIPALSNEEDAPTESDLQPWMLIYYQPDKKQTADEFWKSEGKTTYAWYKPRIKVNGDVRNIVQTATAGAKTPDDQVRLLYLYCQKNIKDLSGPDVSDTERRKIKDFRTSIDTLKNGVGYQTDIAIAFAALVEAAGFTSRPALVSDREVKFFSKELTNPYFLPARDMAVKTGDAWKLYDVSSRYLQPGHLRWQEEGVLALLADDKHPEWIETPMTDSSNTRIGHTGSFKLDENGTVEGIITESFTGHDEEEWRAQNMERSPNQREEHFRKRLMNQLGSAEVTDIQLPDPADLSKPISLRCHIKAEGYATRTGKRLIFAPAFFEMNRPARYASAERKYPVYLRYGWSEVEDVRFEIPETFQLDHPDAPAALALPPFMDYHVKILVTKNVITYHREMSAAGKGTNLQPKERFKGVKQVFDIVHDSDAHLLTLKVQSTSPVAAVN